MGCTPGRRCTTSAGAAEGSVGDRAGSRGGACARTAGRTSLPRRSLPIASCSSIRRATYGVGVVFAQEIPDQLRSRVAGAYRTVNYGVRPLGAVLGGLLGAG